MVKQNQGVEPGARLAELEKDLLGEEVDNQSERETGRKTVKEGTPFQQETGREIRRFQVQQGFRRRHPNSVLGNYAGVIGSASNEKSIAEESLMIENERFELPKQFAAGNDGGTVSQLGIQYVADKNFKNAKNKLGMMHLVGV
jgi:hypothetical protein